MTTDVMCKQNTAAMTEECWRDAEEDRGGEGTPLTNTLQAIKSVESGLIGQDLSRDKDRMPVSGQYTCIYM